MLRVKDPRKACAEEIAVTEQSGFGIRLDENHAFEALFEAAIIDLSHASGKYRWTPIDQNIQTRFRRIGRQLPESFCVAIRHLYGKHANANEITSMDSLKVLGDDSTDAQQCGSFGCPITNASAAAASPANITAGIPSLRYRIANV
jgi:hypothetical protein